ncbi:MAG: aminotransferase class I/II-fold pyridoxal phosphate-dependent enzyme [Microthrixaceae bacterium]|nr:aminotransferase class I/II-fold pyridoxal phosphate-dependent enzyme [Microthrixaceae bacterium]
MEGLPLEGIDLDRLRRRWGQKWSALGEGVLPAWVADADAAPLPVVLDAIGRLLDAGDLTYPHLDAPEQLTTAFAAHVARRHRWHIDPADIVIGTDVVQLMSFAIDRLSEPEAPVMIHTPCYSGLHKEIAALRRRLWPLPWSRSPMGWAASTDDIVAGAEAGARLLILVNPHNPTGRCWSAEELDSLAAVVLEHDLVVASDEVFADLTLDGRQHIPIASLSAEIAARTLTVSSPSKSHNLAGVRCAVAHVGGGPALDPIRRIPTSQLGSVSNVGLVAAMAAWTHGEGWLDAFGDAIADRRDQAVSFIADHLPAAEIVVPEAGYMLWVDLTRVGLPEPVEQFFLDRAMVRVLGGDEFGPGGEGFVRLNLATSGELLGEILERMVTAVDLWRAQ